MRAICSLSLRYRPQKDPWYSATNQVFQLDLPPSITPIAPSLPHRDLDQAKQTSLLFSDPCSIIPACSVSQMVLTLGNQERPLSKNLPPLPSSPHDPVFPNHSVSDLGPNPIVLCKVDQKGVASSPVGLEVPDSLKLTSTSSLYHYALPVWPCWLSTASVHSD